MRSYLRHEYRRTVGLSRSRSTIFRKAARAGHHDAPPSARGRDARLLAREGRPPARRLSPSMRSNRRHTSFAAVVVRPSSATTSTVDIDEETCASNLSFERRRRQHVNKTSSAVPSPNCPPTSWSSCRTSARRSRTAPPRCAWPQSRLIELEEPQRPRRWLATRPAARRQLRLADRNYGCIPTRWSRTCAPTTRTGQLPGGARRRPRPVRARLLLWRAGSGQNAGR